MKMKFTIGLIFIILAFAVYGYFSAVPGAKDSINNPQIKVMPQVFDFGQIDYGQTVEHIFKIKNLGSEILEIRKIATSCACTTAQISKEKINPQEETELKVIYNTGLMTGAHAKGNQERIIYIKSNDPTNPQIEAIISAYVK